MTRDPVAEHIATLIEGVVMLAFLSTVALWLMILTVERVGQ